MNTILLVISTLAMTPCGKITLEATVSEHLNQVSGTVRCEDPGLDEVKLENYVEWMNAGEARSLNDVNIPWVYPNGYLPGHMDIQAQAKDGSYPFQTRLPERSGTLGTMNQVGYMLGGWHPSFSTNGTLTRALIHYSINLPSGVGGLIGNKTYRPGKARIIRGEFRGRFLPVYLSPSFVIYEKGPYRLISSRQQLSPQIDQSIPYGLRDIARENKTQSEEEVLRTLEMLGDHLPDFPQADEKINLVMGPTRKNLCESFDGGVLISDRAFQVLDWERLRRFHRNTLWRYVIQAISLPLVLGRENPEDVSWVQDALSSSLRTQVYQNIYGEQEWASDVLSKFAVIPEIDALIHAPQIALASTYFLALDESAGLDVELSRFAVNAAPGKLFQEKLIDQHGSQATFKVMKTYLQGTSTLQKTLASMIGQPALENLTPWLSVDYPHVDYFLKSIRTEVNATKVEVGLKGDTGFPDVLTVEASVDGELIRRQRLGPGVLTFPGAAKDSQFVVDPDSRLVEHLHAPGEESRYNNYRYPRWRFLLNNISGLFAVTNQELSLAADFSLREIYDQRYRYRFSIHYTPVSIGGSAALAYGFGPELTALRLSHSVSLRAAYSYLRDEGLDLPTGHLGRLSLSYSHDTRISPYFAFKGHGWNAGISSGYHRTDSESGVYGAAGGAIYGILSLPGRQGLLGRLRVDAMTGDAPEQANLRLGGLYRGARGYESDAARSGIFRALATLEHRHAFFTAARIDFAGAIMWTRLEGAFFANATYLPEHDSRCASPLFYDVGYGLRFIGDALNISPAAIVIDVGVPLNACAKLTTHQPVTVYLSFIQSLSGF